MRKGNRESVMHSMSGSVNPDGEGGFEVGHLSVSGL